MKELPNKLRILNMLKFIYISLVILVPLMCGYHILKTLLICIEVFNLLKKVMMNNLQEYKMQVIMRASKIKKTTNCTKLFI